MYYIACIAVGAALVQFLLLPIYIRLKHIRRFAPLKIAIKGSMTLIAVLFCGFAIFTLYSRTGDIHNLVTPKGYETNLLVLIGLTICMIADVMLVIKFVVGMMLFLVGHLCYIAYFLSIAPFNPISIIIFVISATITFIYFNRYKENMGKLKTAYFIYGLVILGTFSIGIMLPFSIGPYGVVAAISAVLLVISDFMLAINNVHKQKVLSDLMYLGYYFMGQYFMALSVFVPIMINL